MELPLAVNCCGYEVRAYCDDGDNIESAPADTDLPSVSGWAVYGAFLDEEITDEPMILQVWICDTSSREDAELILKGLNLLLDARINEPSVALSV